MLIEGIEAGKEDVHGGTMHMVQLLGGVNDAIAVKELLSLLEARDLASLGDAGDRSFGRCKDAVYLDALFDLCGPF